MIRGVVHPMSDSFQVLHGGLERGPLEVVELVFDRFRSEFVRHHTAPPVPILSRNTGSGIAPRQKNCIAERTSSRATF